MTTPPSLPPSPPPKRLKSNEALGTRVEEAPVEALFVPPTAGPSRSTSKPIKNVKKRKQRHHLPEPYSPADVLFQDVTDFLGDEYVKGKVAAGEEAWTAPAELERMAVVELRAGTFTVSGESLSAWPQSGSSQWAVVVPFAHPGDLIRARIYKHDRLHSFADLVEILEYSDEYRGGEGDRRKFPDQGCRYFGECGGCQLQPLPYALQLAHKKRTVQLAYRRFSALREDEMPDIRETIASPKQWGYRTKITPHFDAPPKWAKGKEGVHGPTRNLVGRIAGGGEEESVTIELEGEVDVPAGEEVMLNGHAERENGVDGSAKGQDVAHGGGSRTWECRIGFERKGRPGVMDIEECPIATPVLNAKLKPERKRIQDSISLFKRGATLLLRDSLPSLSPIPSESTPYNPNDPDFPADQHVAITDHKAPVYERVGNFLFSFAAGSFFQNNNSILVPLTEYVREAIFPNVPLENTGTGSDESAAQPSPTHLVDAYCGSGLFGITLSPYFERVAGVEISLDSITAAKRNAGMNGLEGKTEWLCGKAEEIFEGLGEKGFEGERSCVIVDPPRKGCDTQFLTQLLDFKPLTIVYVSCNVHTQARDVGWFVREAEKRGVKYVLESLRGFDLFPQTAHVESVAVLRLA